MYMYYHGTDRERGVRMIKNGMEISKGDDHWLGDGVYLYKSKFYAFRWIANMCNKKYRTKDICILKSNYSVLKVDINSDVKIFELVDFDNKQVFYRFREKYLEMKAQSTKLDNSKCADGAIINLMFKVKGFSEKYDAVLAVIDSNNKDKSTRIGNIQEYQLCIKNVNVIKKVILDITDELDFTLHLDQLEEFDSIKKCRKNSTKQSYKSKRRNYYG